MSESTIYKAFSRLFQFDEQVGNSQKIRKILSEPLQTEYKGSLDPGEVTPKSDNVNVSTTLNDGLYEAVVISGNTNNDDMNVSTTLNSGLYQAVIISGSTNDDNVNVTTSLNSGLYEAVVVTGDTNNDNINVNTSLVGGVYEQV